jgi:outer membrane immunogenic protein
MKWLYALSVTAFGLGLPAAFAADVSPPWVKPPAQAADWSGFYLGAGVGFRSTDSQVNVKSVRDTRRAFPLDDSFVAANCYAGFACVTGQQYNTVSARFAPYFGYNWQANARWVLGIEGDVGLGSQSVTAPQSYPATPFQLAGTVRNSFALTTDWDASFRGRIGYLIGPDLMLYAAAGPSWLHLQSASNCSTSPFDDGECAVAGGFVGLSPGSLSHAQTRLGATVGVGLEAMLSPNWIVRGEYRYSDYGTLSNSDIRTSPSGDQTVNYDVTIKSHVATFGLAYKFGEPSRAPASPVAAYAAIPAATSWTGVYLGAGVGIRSSQTTSSIDSAMIAFDGLPPINYAAGCECFLDSALNGSSARFSPYLGYNWQFASNWLVGIEGDFGWAKQKSSIDGVNEPGSLLESNASLNDSYSVTTKWDASVRLRLGYLLNDGLMVYGTVGPAIMSLEASSRCDTEKQLFLNTPSFIKEAFGSCSPGQKTPVDISNSIVKAGLTVGGGLEAKLWDHWIFRTEYRYSDFGTAKFNNSRSCNGTSTISDPRFGTTTVGCFENDAVQTAVRVRTNTAMFGVAYKFD